MPVPQRFLLFWSLLAAVAAANPGLAVAAPLPSPSPLNADDEAAAPARNAGQIDGRVEDIDYHSGRMTIFVPWPAGRKTYDVVVQPSTSISGQSKAFYEIADIKKGAHVEVLMSQKAGTYIAQIIHLL